jgi:hypothetical protein
LDGPIRRLLNLAKSQRRERLDKFGSPNRSVEVLVGERLNNSIKDEAKQQCFIWRELTERRDEPSPDTR